MKLLRRVRFALYYHAARNYSWHVAWTLARDR